MRFIQTITVLALCAVAAAQTSTRKIVVTGLNASDVANLQASAPAGVRIVSATQSSQAKELIDADGLIGSPSQGELRAAKKLKWIQTHSAGVDRLRYPELLNSDITLTNAKIVMGPNIADHALALLLTLTRGMNLALAAKPTGAWNRSEFNLIELSGKHALVIGVGGIGMQIAQRAHGFGMKVTGVDPEDIPYNPLLDSVVKPDQLDEVIAEADVVFVSAPLTEQSRGMVGKKQFDLMKKGSYFVAVSRGGLYDTNALVRALDSRRLAGAGLDVTDPEPLPSDHPLWKFPNTVITPHVAGQSDEMPGRRMEVFKENIRRFAEGRPMLNVVDKKKGY